MLLFDSISDVFFCVLKNVADKLQHDVVGGVKKMNRIESSDYIWFVALSVDIVFYPPSFLVVL